jgi:hypothetical protein
MLLGTLSWTLIIIISGNPLFLEVPDIITFDVSQFEVFSPYYCILLYGLFRLAVSGGYTVGISRGHLLVGHSFSDWCTDVLTNPEETHTMTARSLTWNSSDTLVLFKSHCFTLSTKLRWYNKLLIPVGNKSWVLTVNYMNCFLNQILLNHKNLKTTMGKPHYLNVGW